MTYRITWRFMWMHDCIHVVLASNETEALEAAKGFINDHKRGHLTVTKI